MLNRRGLRMEPWGTPHVTLFSSDLYCLIGAKKFLFSRYDLSQFSVVPEILI